MFTEEELLLMLNNCRTIRVARDKSGNVISFLVDYGYTSPDALYLYSDEINTFSIIYKLFVSGNLDKRLIVEDKI